MKELLELFLSLNISTQIACIIYLLIVIYANCYLITNRKALARTIRKIKHCGMEDWEWRDYLKRMSEIYIRNIRMNLEDIVFERRIKDC